MKQPLFILTLLLALLLPKTANADAYSLYLESIYAECGTTISIPIYLQNDSIIKAFQFNVSFPDDRFGFEVIGYEEGNRYTENTEVFCGYYSGYYSFGVINRITNIVIEPGEGIVLWLDVKVPANAQGECKICLSNIQLVTFEGTIILDDYNADIYTPLPYIPANSIRLNKTQAEVIEGDTLQLSATVLPYNATDKTVTWASSDSTVATVDGSGTVTAIAPGIATITATTCDNSNLSASCDVTVIPRTWVNSITLNQTTAEVIEGETLQLSATVLPDNADNKTVAWTSNAPSVATVDANGKVNAIAPGIASITATTCDGSNLSASCAVTVSQRILVNSIALNQTTAEVTEGETLQLSATVLPSDAINKNVAWASSNPSSATVDQDGMVRAVKPGSTVITATTTDGTNLSASCDVTVKQSNPITFADAQVKAICVQNWDSNGDGELSYFEASAVSSISQIFTNNKTITSFDELQYFTGLTSIGQGTFYNCTKLTNVTIPGLVNSIGYEAFGNCSSLKSVIIPDAVSSIETYGFYNCSGLTSVIIGNGVTSIKSSVFSGCKSIKSITLGTGITEIIGNEFDWDKSMYLKMLSGTPPVLKKEINVDTVEVPFGHTLDYVSQENWQKIPLIFAVNNDRRYCPVPYYANGDTIVTLNGEPHGIEVEEGAIINVRLSDNYQENPVYESVKYRSEDILDKLKSGTYQFHSVAGHYLNAIYSESATFSDDSIFVANVTESGTLIEIIGTNNVLKVRHLKVSGYLNGTDILAIRKMTNLYLLDMSEAHIVNGGASYYESYTTSEDAIGPYFFQGITNLSHVYLPSDINEIKSYAFHGMTNLKEISVPGTVISIGTDAFNNCTGLTEVILEDGTDALTMASSRIFQNCPIRYVYLGRNIANYSPFKSMVTLRFLTIGNCVTSIIYDGFYECTGLTEVSFGTELKSIGEDAFYGCTGLTTITIPINVRSIGSDAFSSCTGLTELHWNAINCSSNGTMTTNNLSIITIGDAVTVLPTNFAKSSKITSINIPGSVISIYSYAFAGCTALTSIDIPNSVKTISYSAFYGCSALASIHLSNSITKINNSTFGYCRALTSILIPNGVTSIGNEAFVSCTSLTSVVLPSSVTTIGSSAFMGCTALTSINLPTDITTINTSTFKDCISLSSIVIPNSVTSIGGSAFAGCTGLADIFSLNTTPPVIEASTFDETTEQSATLHVPAGCRTIYWLHPYWENFVSIVEMDPVLVNAIVITPASAEIVVGDTLQLTVTVQPEDAFNKTVLWASSNPNVATVDSVGLVRSVAPGTAIITVTATDNSNLSASCAVTVTPTPSPNITFADAKVKALCVQNWDTNCDGELSENEAAAVTSLNEVFSNNETITSFDELQYFTALTAIGDNAFYNCFNLKSVTIPNPVITIGKSAFYQCCKLTSITIPDSVISIGLMAFAYCDGLSSLAIPASVTSIGRFAFTSSGSNLTSIRVSSDNPSYDSREDCNAIIETSTNTLLTGCMSTIIPNTVTAIGESAFANYSRLKSIHIPESVISIGKSAFTCCSELTSINIPNFVTYIGYEAFYGCSGLTNINIPNSVTYIGGGAFKDCTELNDVYSFISDPTIITMGDNVFHRSTNNYSGRTLYVPFGTANVYQADERWYPYFGNIVEMGGAEEDSIISFADANVKAICVQNWDTNGDGELSMSEAATVTTLNGVFRSNKTITSFDELQYFTGLTAIEGYAFYYCINLTSIIIPNGVTAIDNIAFNRCNEMTRLSVVSSNTTYDSRNNCNAIIETATNTLIAGCKNTTIPNSVTSIGRYSFFGCSGLTSIEIPNSVTHIDTHAFYLCDRLSSIDIPNSVMLISADAFNGCGGLTSITVASDNIYYDSRNNCNAIIDTRTNTLIRGCENTIIPNSVTSIGSFAFNECTKLTSIEIPNTVTSIGNSAFDCCSKLASIIIPNSVTSIGEAAFQNCINLKSVKLSNSINVIDDFVFNYSGLTSIDIPNSVTSIGIRAFCDCTGLTTLSIPNSVTFIDEDAFSGCIGLTSIDIPNSVTYIGGGAFKDCTELNDVYSFIFDPTIITMGDNVFHRSTNNYSGRTLHVPAGTLAAYQADEKWYPYFGSIVEMEQEATEYLTMPDTAMFQGKTVVIPVKMVNEGDIIAFQTDIFLPEGLEIVKEDGEYVIDASGRMTRTHSILSDDVSSGAVRVLCYSSNYKPFTGESGDDLFYITVKAADDAAGDYTISLRNTLFTTSDFEELAAPDVAANVHILAYLLGDANNSGTVTVTDVVVTSQYVLERDPEPFNFNAADVNADGTITVTDVSRIAWMVLNPDAKAPKRLPTLMSNSDHMSGECFTIGETHTVSITLDNMMGYSAFQLDLTLPDGLTAGNFALTDRDGSHVLDVNTLANGKTRALCYSPALSAISGNEGAVLTFEVTATGIVTGDIIVDGIELITTDCQTVRPDAFDIAVNTATSMNEAPAGKTVARIDYYNVAGQRIARPEGGITLVVTTYTDGTRTSRMVY